jgi:hypothetical protein
MNPQYTKPFRFHLEVLLFFPNSSVFIGVPYSFSGGTGMSSETTEFGPHGVTMLLVTFVSFASTRRVV